MVGRGSGSASVGNKTLLWFYYGWKFSIIGNNRNNLRQL